MRALTDLNKTRRSHCKPNAHNLPFLCPVALDARELLNSTGDAEADQPGPLQKSVVLVRSTERMQIMRGVVDESFIQPTKSLNLHLTHKRSL